MSFQELQRRLQKPVKRRTVRAKRRAVKAANIKSVREQVEAQDGGCRVTRLLAKFEFRHRVIYGPLDLAHLEARGMGGNRDLSRDTPENTLMVLHDLHVGRKYTMHGGYLKVRPLTARGTRGPCCFEFYEQLPTEAK